MFSTNKTPTLYGSEAVIPSEQAKSLVGQLKSLSLQPFLTPSQFGIDGVTFGVETKSHWLRCRLSWRGEPPESWKQLAEWLDKTVDSFDKLLPASTAKITEAQFGF